MRERTYRQDRFRTEAFTCLLVIERKHLLQCLVHSRHSTSLCQTVAGIGSHSFCTFAKLTVASKTKRVKRHPGVNHESPEKAVAVLRWALGGWPCVRAEYSAGNGNIVSSR